MLLTNSWIQWKMHSHADAIWAMTATAAGDLSRTTHTGTHNGGWQQGVVTELLGAGNLS